MISLQTAQRLKEAGLTWLPEANDFFAIPDRNLDDQVFVLSDLQATIELIQGKSSITFQGSSEWALDDLLTEEAVWLPREDQLRKALEAVLIRRGEFRLVLEGGAQDYYFEIECTGHHFSAHSSEPSELYASGLLFFLETEGS